MDQPELMNTMDELDTFGDALMLPQHQRHKTWLVMAREQATARTAGEPSEEDIRKELTRRAKRLAQEFVVSLLLLWLLLDLNAAWGVKCVSDAWYRVLMDGCCSQCRRYMSMLKLGRHWWTTWPLTVLMTAM